MTKIEAIIRPEKLDDVLTAIEKIGYSGVMITEIRGHGKQKGLVQSWRGEQYKVSFLTKIKIEIVAKDADTSKIMSTITSVARTGEIGDGKIFTYEIKETMRIRTGESGEAAL
jgi:nitrogen regulatory protein P-II 1